MVVLSGLVWLLVAPITVQSVLAESAAAAYCTKSVDRTYVEPFVASRMYVHMYACMYVRMYVICYCQPFCVFITLYGIVVVDHKLVIE